MLRSLVSRRTVTAVAVSIIVIMLVGFVAEGQLEHGTTSAAAPPPVEAPEASGLSLASALPVLGDTVGDDRFEVWSGQLHDFARSELGTSHPRSTLATATITEGNVRVWATPDSSEEPAWNLAVPTEFGGPRHFLVIGETTNWLEVQVPVRPNGTTGWIPRSAVELSDVSTSIEVDLSERTVVVTDGHEVVMEVVGTVGKQSTPTPVGSFYIRDAFPWYADSVYGPWVLALSAYSEAIDTINGGAAVVALHGTVRPDLAGTASSLGCVRLDNETITELAALVGPGTPVEIVP